MKRTCVQCGKEFELTDSEVDFYRRKNLNVSKRCQACRDKNKQQNGAPQKRPAGGGSGKGMMAAVVGILLLFAVFFCLKQTGILSDGTDAPSNVTALQTAAPSPETTVYTFRSEKLLLDHYKKHGIEMGFDSAEAYAEAANQVIHNPDVLHKLEAEDGDDVYYLEATNEFVIVSTDGYIRTYFNPDDGIDYYNRQ